MTSSNIDFYAAAAQIIPILFLALAFQSRTGFFPSVLDDLQARIHRQKAAGKFETPTADKMRALLESEGYELPTTPEADERLFRELKRGRDRSLHQSRVIAAIGTVLGMAALVYGEAVALGVLQSHRPSHGTERSVGVSILVGAALIFLPIIRDRIASLESLHPIFVERPYWIAFTSIALLIVLALYAYPI